MSKQIDRLDNMLKGVRGWVDDWEIVNCMDDDMGEEWCCLLSDVASGDKPTMLAKANNFLATHESMFRVFDVAENENDYNWAFILA